MTIDLMFYILPTSHMPAYQFLKPLRPMLTLSLYRRSIAVSFLKQQ